MISAITLTYGRQLATGAFFLTIARVKSFTGAASILNVTQPARTMQIRRLEQALGVTLFDRDTRSVELTRVARDLLPAFERTLQDFDTALDSARDIATQERGIVRLATLPSFAAGVLPDAILQFRHKRPNVVFDLKDVIAGQVLSLVELEQVDFGCNARKGKSCWCGNRGRSSRPTARRLSEGSSHLSG